MNSYGRIFSIILILVFLFSTASAQQRGSVSDETGAPIENALVFHLKTAAHTHTDEMGRFILDEARPGDSIRISHVGYQNRLLVAMGSNVSIRLTKTEFQLNEVVINSSVRHLNMISAIDLATNPVNSSQELLRTIPGLFIGQHAGGGKAEQIFLRGFDIDHGTDIQLTVDGMPVNMVSHAHGQGYADLHFLLPELVDKIDFDKGPYYASKGNLATAGYAAFQTKDRLDKNSIVLEGGNFNSFRTLGMFDLINTEKQAAYLATEYRFTDGPFQSPQHFNRINLASKFTQWMNNDDKFSVGITHFTSKWNASGQVPQRAVDAGLIDRFGAIDDTEGGQTSRTNINLQFIKHIDQKSYVRNSAYYNRYDFELYSNFTFYLNDPVNGDQIRQKEKRSIAGLQTEYNRRILLPSASILLQAASGFRFDDINNIELSHTLNRSTVISPVMLGDIDETNLYGYVNAEYKKGKWLINPAIRFDYLQFTYNDKLAGSFSSKSNSKAIISPKLNFLYQPNNRLELFLKMGKGFHSNDTRVVIAQQGRRTLPAAYGADAGILFKPASRLVVNAAVWYLYLQQEFIYVGDEGIVEPGGRTRRKGLDLGIRYQLTNGIFLNGDYTYTVASAIDEPKGQDYIPLAPKHTFTGGVSVHRNAWSGAVKARWLGDRPANEDNSILAHGYFVTDMNINYTFRSITFSLKTENIFNTKWNETQFATESRLQNEPSAVTEIHFTPGTPFAFRTGITFNF